jgi:hypothetical protein
MFKEALGCVPPDEPPRGRTEKGGERHGLRMGRESGGEGRGERRANRLLLFL